MNTQELHNIITSGENEITEFKLGFNNEAIITLTAFVNTNGGKLLIGLDKIK